MHELSIALSILDMAEEEGRQRRGRIAAIHVKLGRLVESSRRHWHRPSTWRGRYIVGTSGVGD